MHNLKDALKNGTVYVTFTKKDGTIRHMNCTKNFDLIPADKHPTGSGGYVNPDIIKVFDVDISEWRSFSEDQVEVWTVWV
jgi:hypothetical protein